MEDIVGNVSVPGLAFPTRKLDPGLGTPARATQVEVEDVEFKPRPWLALNIHLEQPLYQDVGIMSLPCSPPSHHHWKGVLSAGHVEATAC
ncbi:hypothetical protein AAY473_002676 [Plecturocebus cupreus]